MFSFIYDYAFTVIQATVEHSLLMQNDPLSSQLAAVP